MLVNNLWNYIRNNISQLTKYAIVGAVGAVVDFGLLFIMTDKLGIYYLISATFAFIISATVNYTLNRAWTFRSNGQRRKQLPVFFIIATLGLIINNNIMYFSVEKLEWHYLLAKVLAAAVVTVWNFFGNKYLTFRIK